MEMPSVSLYPPYACILMYSQTICVPIHANIHIHVQTQCIYTHTHGKTSPIISENTVYSFYLF